MSYELLMLLRRKIFSTTKIYLTWWWFPSHNKQGKKIMLPVPQKMDGENSGEYLVYTHAENKV